MGIVFETSRGRSNDRWRMRKFLILQRLVMYLNYLKIDLDSVEVSLLRINVLHGMF